MFGVVTTGYSSISEQLTYDRQVLDSAISKVTGGGLKAKEIIEGQSGSQGPTELRHRAHVAFSTAYDLMKNLEKLQNRRKAVIYISSGYDFNPFEQSRLEEQAQRMHVESSDLQNDPFYRTQQSTQLLAESDLVRELAELTRAANRANATLYTIDPRGLVAGQDLDDEVPTQEWNAYVRDTQDSLRVLAEETGGIAVVNQNDFDKALKRIDNETSDYYVLGYYSSNPDPLRRRRKIEVKTTQTESECVVAWRIHAAADYAPRISDRPASALRAASRSHLGRAHRSFELRAHRLEDANHLSHRARQPSHLRIQPACLTHQRCAGDSTAEQLMGGDVGRRRLPRDDADAEAAAHHRLDDLDVLRLHDDRRRDPLAREELIDDLARDRSGLEQHEWLALEIRRHDLLLRSKRVTRIRGEQQFLREQRNRHEIRRLDRKRQQAQVSRARSQHLNRARACCRR